jgi:membrane associated rhomboid family serine protease
MFPLHDDNPTRRPAILNWTLIAINVLVFLYMLQMPPAQRQWFVIEHGFIPARIAQLVTPRPLLVHFEVLHVDPRTGWRYAVEQPYQILPDSRSILASLFTAMFIHGGWLHLIGNLWFLAIFGNNIEDRLGHLLYLIFYLGGGLLASAGQWMQDPGNTTPMVGASGAIAAVLGAYAVTYPHARVHTLIFLGFFFTTVDLPALLVLGLWFVGQVFSARADIVAGAAEGVAFMAHVAGFASGAVLMLGLKLLIPPPLDDQPEQRRDEVFDYL